MDASAVADKPNRFYVYMIAGISAVGGFIFGYDLNVVTPAVLYLQEEYNLSPLGVSVATLERRMQNLLKLNV